jgi:putative ABC transport system substrate-binding protein
VIAATGSMATVLAAKEATTTIPIVFNIGVDPVKAGLVAALNRPGGNITGITSVNNQLGTKWVGLMHELLPNATRLAVLADPKDPMNARHDYGYATRSRGPWIASGSPLRQHQQRA